MGEEHNVWVLLDDDSVIWHRDAKMMMMGTHEAGGASLTIYPHDSYSETIAFYPGGRYMGATSVEAVAEQWGWERPDPELEKPLRYAHKDTTAPVIQMLAPDATPLQWSLMLAAAREHNIPVHLTADQLALLLKHAAEREAEPVISYPLLAAAVLHHAGPRGPRQLVLNRDMIEAAEKYAVTAKQHGDGSVSLTLVEVPPLPADAGKYAEPAQLYSKADGFDDAAIERVREQQQQQHRQQQEEAMRREDAHHAASIRDAEQRDKADQSAGSAGYYGTDEEGRPSD